MKNSKTKSPIWLSADADNRIIYFNPGLRQGEVARITASGVETIEVPASKRHQYPVPHIGSRNTGVMTMSREECDQHLAYFDQFFISQLPMGINDRMFFTGWLLSAPLVAWLEQPLHIRLVGRTNYDLIDTTRTYQVLLYGNYIDPFRIIPYERLDEEPTIIATKRVGSILDSTWVPPMKLWVDAMCQASDRLSGDRRIVKLTCNRTLSDPRCKDSSDDSIHMLRAQFLSAQCAILSDILRQYQSELVDLNAGRHARLRLANQNGRLEHLAVIRYINSRIETAIHNHKHISQQR